MTIEIYGHLHSLTNSGSWVEVCVQIEADRGVYELSRNHGPRLTVKGRPEEVANYKPGMPIVLRIQPDPARSRPNASGNGR